MELIEASEYALGLVLTKRLPPKAIKSESLAVPYNHVLQEILREGKINIDNLAINHGPTVINACTDAAKSLNGLGEIGDWPKILDQSAALYQAGLKMDKMSKQLLDGKDIDWSQFQTLSRAAQAQKSENLIPLSEIEPGEVPFIETGWKVFDREVGGIPEVGLVIAGGRPGVGKTWWMVKMTTCFAKQHPKKNVAVFSLEMILKEIASRYKGKPVPEKLHPNLQQQKRLFLCEKPVTAEEIIQICSTIPDLGMVCIDFSDLVIKGEATEGSTSTLYKTLALGAKDLNCPILLLSQLSRKQGIPKPSDLRYSGLAEALGWMVLMLYDPATDWTNDEEESELPVVDGAAYIIVWKIRGGFRKHAMDSPGALQIPFRGNMGWHGTEGKWISLRKYER